MPESVFDIFREEAREHLSALEKGFLDLEAAAAEKRRGLIDSLFRHAHSLKGDAKAVGVLPLKVAAQVLEDLLDSLRSAPEELTSEHINQGLAQFDAVRGAFESWQQPGSNEPSRVQSAHPAPASPPIEKQESHKDHPQPHSAVEPAPLEPVMSRQVAVEPATGGSAHPAPESPQIKNQKSKNEDPVDESFTVRVSSERLDRMMNVAGEVRIAQRSMEAVQGRLADLIDHLDTAVRDRAHQSPSEIGQAFEFALDQVRRIASDIHNRRVSEELLMESLQADIRQARLLPLLMLTESLRRSVRDLSQSLGKQIRYEVDVGQILLDKAVIEALKDPLVHLIRNAADHGLETPEARRAAGKPEEGVIRIQAQQQGPVVRITLTDDGRGVDYERIRARLRNSGEVAEDELPKLSERDLVAYLFRPGFTTATAGDVSGRGVGLDVVADTVRRLQGTVTLESSSRAGTTFVITVPVTISTIRVLTVMTAGQTFAIPSSMVVRTGRAARKDLRELEGGVVLNLNGEPLRWTRLAELLGLLSSRPTTNGESWPYLLIAQANSRMVVSVDDVEDESEVLLKPLGFPLSGVPGILGGTIRADGSVQLLLDLASNALTASGQRSETSRAETEQARRIMVVDDSPTTRAIMRNVFTAAGYSVVTATDGMDALERLRSHPVDLVVSDVEMPRLNGFDLTRQIKSKFGLPVILVTGREKEEHRREGMEAGADAYVVKSTFEGEGLLQIVEQWV
jgi:two-component system chemotaxis sensor kinase CheA